MASTGNVKTEEIYGHIASNEQVLDGFRTVANALLKAHLAKADDTYISTESTNKQTVSILLSILCIAIILGIILTVLIVKPISSSLKAATKYLGIVSEGDFTTAVSIQIQNTIEIIDFKAKESALASSDISNRANVIKSNAIESKNNADEIYFSTNKNLREAIEKSKSVEQIKALSEAILQITSQTNLLALNASI